ncbi:complex I NDUFA9 subunit family protein [Loktanella sp. SALINAS62]|uniref:complex I NDUFA9 subunit family protein n=1 Tax=Loktanella sp. SALINAS62 TaxID=2706124 RepID=UPI001B8D1272|nr:complex I NDUFA9 subunit family protein [Loktanella sp. SALINAS62]MBS1301799.1 complex I NDUFA9 subunit family protein [Loktanella sp. SALINAS62]
MSKLVTIFGGSGFLGRYVARRLAQDGWRIRVACRTPNEAMFVRTYGNVGQVEPVFCNVRDDDSVRSVTRGADAVVNCVGVLAEKGKNTFKALQAEAPARIARIAREEGIDRMVQISAIGASQDADSDYAKTKAQGEAALREHQPDAVILRPSIVFGSEDEFFNRFAGMSRMGPVLPVVGADTLFQPVYVDDVAKAVHVALTDRTVSGVYELGGPDVATFRDLMHLMLKTINRNNMVVNIPFFVARVMAAVFGALNKITFGLAPAPLTTDQVKNLAVDNVVSDDARGFAALGLTPTSMEAVLPDYLWRFRPSGQYAAIKNSARNLKLRS